MEVTIWVVIMVVLGTLGFLLVLRLLQTWLMYRRAKVISPTTAPLALVCGRECDREGRPEERFRRLLLAAIRSPVQCILLSGGVHFGCPTPYHECGRNFLIKLGYNPTRILTPAARPQQLRSAYGTYEELRNLRVCHGGNVIIICERLQKWRVMIYAAAVGYRGMPIHTVDEKAGIVNALYQGAMFLYTLLDPKNAVLRKSALVKKIGVMVRRWG